MFLTFNDQYDICVDTTGNDDAARLTAFKRDINIATGELRSQLSKFIFEETRTDTSVANQQAYDLDPRLIRVHEVTYTSGGIQYYLEEIKARDQWRFLNETSTASSDIPRFYFLDKDQVHLYPKPGTAGDTITIIGEERFKKMTAANYTTGTIALTNGSAVVTGSSTTFTAAMVGRYLMADDDGYWYEIESFSSTTSITLDRTFRGTTDATSTFVIGEQALGPYEDLHMLPVYYALSNYYALREDSGLRAENHTLWTVGKQKALETYGKKSASAVIPNTSRIRRRDPNHFSTLS